jgi:hypothetical protein
LKNLRISLAFLYVVSFLKISNTKTGYFSFTKIYFIIILYNFYK